MMKVWRRRSQVRPALAEFYLWEGEARARSHCRFAPPLICFIPYSPMYSAPLCLKRECDRTLGEADGDAIGPTACAELLAALSGCKALVRRGRSAGHPLCATAVSGRGV